MTYLDDFVDTYRRQRSEAAAHAGAMIALVPEASSAWRLAVPGYEAPDVLHVTLMFLGKGDSWTEEQQLSLLGRAAEISQEIAEDGPVTGSIWAAASVNPKGVDPCAAYLVGGHRLTSAHRYTSRMLSPTTRPLVPSQHSPWVPHITIGYGLDAGQLNQATGAEVRFDRLRVAFSGAATDFSL
jgi:2'-5' RNA ligase